MSTSVLSQGCIALLPGKTVSLEGITGNYLLNRTWAMSFQVLLHAANPGGQIFSVGSNQSTSDLRLTYGLDTSVKINKTYRADGTTQASTSGLPNDDIKAYFRYKDNHSQIFMLNSFSALTLGVWVTFTITVTRKSPNDDSIHVIIYTDGIASPAGSQHIWDYYGSRDTSTAVLGGGVNATFKNIMFWEDHVPTAGDILANNSRSTEPPPNQIFNLDKTENLLRTFAPLVYICKGEQYFPMKVTDYIQACKLFFPMPILRNSENEVLVLDKIIPWQIINDQSIIVDQRRIYSSFGKTPEKTKFHLTPLSRSTRKGVAPADLQGIPFYGYSCPGANYCDLTYGFFYAYDGGNDGNILGALGSHDGDWEHIIVRIGLDAKNSFSEDSPVLGVYYQAHRQSDRYSGWYYPPPSVGQPGPSSADAVFEWEVKDKRVRVYAAREAHGSYTKAGSQKYTFIWPDDITSSDGPQWGETANIYLMTGEEDWNDYNGKIGDSPYSPKVQEWLIPNSRPGGPGGSTAIRVGPLDDSIDLLADGRGGGHFSSYFKLDFFNQVQVLFESTLTDEQLAGLIIGLESKSGSESISIESVKHKMLIEKIYSRELFVVAKLEYTDSTGIFRGGDVFERLGIRDFVLRLLDRSLG
jgi:hypothetical protein